MKDAPPSRVQDLRNRLGALLRGVAASGEAGLDHALQELESCLQSLQAVWTEREQLEAQLLQARRMEALGRLAGSVAHDFNNLLTAILGRSELLLASLPPIEPIYHDAEEILRAAERASVLTRQLLALSREKEQPEPDSPPLQVLPGASGNETVLLVEEDEVVRRLAGELLRQSGYIVLEARDGAEALRLGRDHPGPVHLLVTDAIMPDLTGVQLFEQLRPLRPAVKVLYVSGHMDGSLPDPGGLRPGTALLRKPFRAHDLVRKVRQLLDTDATEPH
jgi:CheY-like chemotaxis protein